MAALRQGCKHICVDVPAETHEKIAAMAEAQSARLHGPVGVVLDLAAVATGETAYDRNQMEALIANFLCGDAYDV